MDENASLFFRDSVWEMAFFLLRRSLTAAHQTADLGKYQILRFFPLFPDLTVRMLRRDDGASDIELPGSLSAADPRLHLVRLRNLQVTLSAYTTICYALSCIKKILMKNF